MLTAALLVALAHASPDASAVASAVVASNLAPQQQAGAVPSVDGPTGTAAPAADAATEGAAPARLGPLQVVVAGSEPFVVSQGEVIDGMSVAVWRAIADAIGVEYTLTEVDHVADAIDAVNQGRADVAIGPLSITSERERKVDFTHSYFHAKLGILTRSGSTSALDRFRPFLTRAFAIGFVSLLLILLGVGTIVWLVERRANPEQFPDRPSAGIGNGMWFALVTMTTVGYGDRAPVTRLGRLVTSVWMLIAMLAASSMTAGIATALTLSQIDSGVLSDVESLRKHRVAVVEATPAELIARRYGALVRAVGAKQTGIELVEDGTVEAMLYDLPVLQSYLKNNERSPLIVFESKITADDYGFAVPKGRSELEDRLNIAILDLRESEHLSRITERWLGE